MRIKELSKHALCAKEIGQQLKRAYPEVKFSVTSESYSGGTSINIRYTHGPSVQDVRELVSCYEYGHFDGMTDSYEMSNVDKGVPQVKFVFVNRDITYEEAIV